MLAPDADWDPRITEFFEHWKSIMQEDGSPPRRRSFDPVSIHKLLPWVWMADVFRNPWRFKFRLMGTKNVDVMGWDVTGKWIDEAYPDFGPEKPGYQDYLAVAADLQASYRRGPAQYHVPDYREIERIMLPMVDENRVCRIILAMTIYR